MLLNQRHCREVCVWLDACRATAAVTFFGLTFITECVCIHCFCCICSKHDLLVEHEKKEREFENTIEGMRERDRRAYLRKLEKEQDAISSDEED